MWRATLWAFGQFGDFVFGVSVIDGLKAFAVFGFLKGKEFFENQAFFLRENFE